MEIIIHSLIESAIDTLICDDIDRYASLDRCATDEDNTVDLRVRVRTVAIDDSHIIFEFPNGSVLAVNLPSTHYHKIEVL